MPESLGLPALQAGRRDTLADRSRLARMKVTNLGCVGPEGLTVELDEILCLVGPNNSGKSTILRAYELAAGKAVFTEHDLCKRAGDAPASVELWVHVPAGTPNIAEKWKTAEGSLSLVRSKWEWSRASGLKRVRTTWDPETEDWATDTKAAGLDEVFESRLPVPLRVGTLQDPEEEHKALLALVLQPIADRLTALQRDTASEVKQALDAFIASAQKPVEEEREKISHLKADLNRSQTQIFPNLSVDLDIGLGTIEIDLKGQLTRHSGVRFTEWADEVRWSQQGTGSQRALFWALLQVRSRLQTRSDLGVRNEKAIADLKKKIAKLQKEEATARKDDTRAVKRAEITQLEDEIERRQTTPAGAAVDGELTGLALPGYMLLIDEPEVGLHPAAIRAASRYLYALVDDPAWQVILSTHAPSFIDPLQDHTTIVRLSRCQANPTPSTYRAEEVAFSADEKENLKMLNRFDQALAEMFFGQHPILIEGDTEFAAFEQIMNQDRDAHPISERPILVRSHGKHALKLIIRMLRHFKVSFSVLHDSDTPYGRDGTANSAWEANAGILEEVAAARTAGLRVVHRICVPAFELVHLPVEKDEAGHAKFPPDKDKPWRMLAALEADDRVRGAVRKTFDELRSAEAPDGPFDGDDLKVLLDSVTAWAAEHSPSDTRFFGKSPN
jgi:putative ATP-dependent endonuclease of OLD family